ncbi:MAG: matrixin family metalloprotease [Verrucomicrobiales bacterium]
MKTTTHVLGVGFISLAHVQGVSVVVDYTYDTNSFFTGNAAAMSAMERAAARWSNILSGSQLSAAAINDTNDGRIGFSHPGTGNSFEISGAANSGSDSIVGAGGSVANDYRSITFNADEWILFAGGRSTNISSDGIGGTGTGTNFTSVFTDPTSHLNRGFNSGSNSLPTWGGAISFDSSTSWDFTDDASGSGADFYTIALHEIGHALGLAANWDDMEQHVSGSSYSGAFALAAVNADNGTSLTSLNLVSSSNYHWADQAYQSMIFAFGNPSYDGTVGEGNLQDLIMDPIANTSVSIDRLELTNADIGLARDIGWQVIPEPSTLLLAGLGLLGFSRRRK